ncbi:hypothetical protein Bbelb_249440 [Branchiostoma belcheri]|nr:hypothetical protein Bbelb_249440 [Branchiostoma belcheri]
MLPGSHLEGIDKKQSTSGWSFQARRTIGRSRVCLRGWQCCPPAQAIPYARGFSRDCEKSTTATGAGDATGLCAGESAAGPEDIAPPTRFPASLRRWECPPPARDINALHAFTVHAFTVHAFTVHAFTLHAFTVNAFTVHAFTVHAFTVHALKYPHCEQSTTATGAGDATGLCAGESAAGPEDIAPPTR